MKNTFFQLPEDEMRRIGYKVIDTLIDHYQTLSEKPAGGHKNAGEITALFDEAIPEKGMPFDRIFAKAQKDIFPNNMYPNHPRFFAWVPGPHNFISVMADTLASGYNVFSGMERAGAAANQIERIVIQWLTREMDMGPLAGGVLTSGGSVANLIGLATAREALLEEDCTKAVIYCSDQTHKSNFKALKILGFSLKQLSILPTNDSHQLSITHLQAQIALDRQMGKRPFCVIANAGTTNTGAVDPLVDIRKICDQEECWMHVDAAYGGAAWLAPRGRQALQGMHQADSLTIDPHKWLYQPYDIGGILVKNTEYLQRAFQTSGAYLKETEGYQNFADKGIQLSRRFRALPLWMSIKHYGLDTFRQAIQYTMALTDQAASILEGLPHWKIMTAPQLGIVTFRFAPDSISFDLQNKINLQLADHIMDEQGVVLSSTTIRNHTVLRMCTINPHTSSEDLEMTLTYLDFVAHKFYSELSVADASSVSNISY
ncbi:pyridoxal phosphate-dependent decarboxylase family protein [Tunicatimonas pelagia]|uniref:pyridoxal phosphate-dependent decarboxylase family protein n=1 Tax=Tunicatimonas pelagia TaxID=931531 RepID=UPI002666528E|nr:aminotransferase class V-fold PLP-dependent enzyme [Tunicatimonas pelagia]WKN45719.1 aminotransferase class V-fold PLP-dependent enzyme [Tunicatimonas pelagia]